MALGGRTGDIRGNEQVILEGQTGDIGRCRNIGKQAGAELGQAQLQLGLRNTQARKAAL